jgi:uncharacterized protein YrrD
MLGGTDVIGNVGGFFMTINEHPGGWFKKISLLPVQNIVGVSLGGLLVEEIGTDNFACL